MKQCVFVIELMLCLILIGSASADSDIKEFNGFEYTIQENETIRIVRYNGNKRNVEIPEHIEDRPVTVIGTSAFENNEYIKEITIAKNIETIEDKAFSNCERLQSISLPASCKTICTEAFCGCDKLTEVNFSNGLVSIGESAFRGCDMYSISIPNSVRIIEKDAFYDCGLWEVELGNGLIELGDFAFGWNNIKSIQLPESIKKIGKNPFIECKYLKRISIIPDHAYFAIVDDALYSKQDKKLICYPLEIYKINFQIPMGILSIGACAFYGCESYLDIKMPNSLKEIGDEAFSFSNCKILIPESVEFMGANPFVGMSLSSITIDKTNKRFVKIDEIGCRVIYDRMNCRLVSGSCAKFPEGVKTIGDKWNSCNYYITEVVLPSTVTAIETEAFSFCTNLEKITIPKSVNYIGDNCFDTKLHLKYRRAIHCEV